MSRAYGAKALEISQMFSYVLPGDLGEGVTRAHNEWSTARKTARLWNRDASLWTNSDESKCLGWLDISAEQLGAVDKFKALAAEVAEDGFRHILLLGMGGSSLAPEVFRATYGKRNGWPELLVLDSTDPEQIRSFRSRIDPARTLFCVSSKSGTTLEPNIYLQYFFEEAKKSIGDRAGHHFIAVTDPDSKLEGLAAKLGFRRVYHGVPSIGGRYSALSDFGLIPHATAGYDTEGFLKRASGMVKTCQQADAYKNPGVSLGLILGTAAAKCKRDKLTLLCSRSIFDLGAWLEQLIAESTGKHGHGLIPIDREPLVEPAEYASDRIFAYIKYARDGESELDEAVDDIEEVGQPVIRIVLNDLQDLGQVMFQWEVATAVAGHVIGINPFDQPDVEASKVVTREITAEFEQSGLLRVEQPLLEQDGIKLFTDATNSKALINGSNTLGASIRRHLDRLRSGDYFALLAYIPMFPEYEDVLQEMRTAVLESKQVATVLGFGPRFLHSTGQAYKGGPNSGVFLQITCDEKNDLPVPQQKYTFGVVKSAQARGDFQVLAERHRRVLRVHLSEDVEKDLKHLRDLICASMAH
jgi:glucose-6-phosphate isomerase